MVKVTYPKDCDNAPRKKFIVDFNTAFANSDNKFIADAFHESISWNMFGDFKIEGKTAAVELLESMNGYVAELELKNVITHGPVAAAEGIMKLADGKTYAFCDTFRFVSAGKNIIKELNSYVIKIQ